LIRDELERHDTLADFKKCFDSERVLGLQLIKEQGIVMAFRIEEYLRFIHECQENSNKTIAEQAELLDGATSEGSTAAMIYPAIQLSRGAALRKLSQVRCLRLLIELNQQTNDQPSLDDIKLPVSAATDPISGNPLIFWKT
jgi:hypothetical protein